MLPRDITEINDWGKERMDFEFIFKIDKDSNQKLLKWINKFIKVAGYKINIQKSIEFLYTNNEILEKEYKNTIRFKIAPPKIKYTWEYT